MQVEGVFEDTKVIISQSFLEKMPAHISKIQFFKETFSTLQCVVKSHAESTSYSLEGVWDDVLKAQDSLLTLLKNWSSEEKSAEVHCSGQSDNFTCEDVDEVQLGVQKACKIRKNITKKLTDSCIEELSLRLQYSRQDETVESSVTRFQDTYEVGRTLIADNIISGSDEQQTCTQVIPSNHHERQLHLTEATENNFSQETQAFDNSVENEVCVDIKLEHNYNHHRAAENIEHESESGPTIENEIYMDIQLSKPNDKIIRDPNMPVTLVVAKEDEPGVEVVQLSVGKPVDVTSQKQENEVNCLTRIQKTQDELKLRRKKYEEQAPYKYFCSQCSFKTKRHSHMRNHTRLHEKVCTIYSCDECNFSTIRASHLQRHIGTHKTEVYACSECSFSTHTEASLTKHQRYKHILKKTEEPKQKDTFMCVHCDYTTVSEKHFERHLAVHSKKGRVKLPCFKCNKCSYQTPSRSNYLRHLVVHDYERPFMCTTCGLCFKRSDTLVQHQSTRHQSGSGGALSCPQCKKFCRSASALKEHQLTHNEERRYLCEICAASFKTRAVQRKHYNQKHVHAKKHVCPTCSKGFISQYLLKRHMKVHNSNGPCSEETESQQITAVSNEWCSSLVPIQPQSEDVQVIVLHQEPSESEVSIQGGPLFQIASSLVPGQALSVPVIPVEYMIPASESKSESTSAETAADYTTDMSTSGGEIIALTFMPKVVHN